MLILWLSLGAAVEIPMPTTPQISVSITGFVRNPGNYKMSPTDRVSDLIAKAQQELQVPMQEPTPAEPEEDLYQRLNPIPLLRAKEEPEPDYAHLQALRHVSLKRNDSPMHYDLLRFYRLGSLADNPILRDGDLVHISIVQEIISVNGCVGQSGELEYRQGDTLETVLNLAYKALPGADTSAIRISRYQGSGKAYAFEVINLKEYPALLNTVIHPSDRIMVPYDALFRARKTVTVSGELRHHGEFIVDDKATVWDVIQLAGGFTEKADLSNAVMLNKSFNEEPDGEFERLKMRSMAELTPLEYSYMRTIMRQAKGAYSIDFVKLKASEGKESNRVMNNMDFIYVPEKLNAVWVSGQVRKPGLVEYQPGKNWKYYVQQTGGFANNNIYRGTRILRSDSGNWVKAKNKQEIKPGDIVFIPDRVDRYFWTDVKDVITVAASAITILIGVQNLRK